jgi:hypothetical protein
MISPLESTTVVMSGALVTAGLYLHMPAVSN